MMLLLARRWWPYLLGAVLALAAWAWLTALRPGPIPPEILSPRVDSALVAARARAQVLDSVRSRQLAVDDSLRVERATRDLRVAVLVREAATQERRAHALADSARALGDTVSVAWATAEAWRVRGDSLTVALVVSDSARSAEHARAEMWRLTAASESAGRSQVASLADQLREAVDRAAQKKRDWGVSLAAGPGCTIAVNGADGACGASVTVGVSRRIF